MGGVCRTKIKDLFNEYGSRQKYWLAIFEYKDGLLLWKEDRSNTVKKGSLVGYTNLEGYRTTFIFGRTFYVHKIIWEMFNGDTLNEVDHKDRVLLNNKIENLREATHQQNVRNISTPKHNSSGIKGVCWHKKNQKWNAQIGINGKRKSLGYFDDIEDAEASYKEASLAIHGEFSHYSIEGLI